MDPKKLSELAERDVRMMNSLSNVFSILGVDFAIEAMEDAIADFKKSDKGPLAREKLNFTLMLTSMSLLGENRLAKSFESLEKVAEYKAGEIIKQADQATDSAKDIINPKPNDNA